MTIPRPQEWTKAEVHQLRMLAKRKVSADSIAKLLTDDSAFIRALGNLARAQGMGTIAEEANVDRAGLYRSLRGDMDPAFGTVLKVLAALGIQSVAKPAAGL